MFGKRALPSIGEKPLKHSNMNLFKATIEQDILTRELNKLNEHEVLALGAILNEYRAAKKKHPIWPTDLIHGTAVISEELGELVRECNDLEHKFIKHDEICECSDRITNEAIQVGAMGLRFLANLIK